MSQSPQQFSHLIKAAKARNIQLSQDDLNTIKTAPADSSLSQWLTNFNRPQLPTPEELQIWKHIQDRNSPPSASRSSSTEILTDRVLRRSINDLEASTRRLEAQTAAMTTQHSLLSQHSKQASRQRSQLTSQISPLHRKYTLQAQHVHFANDAKITELKAGLRSRLEQLEKEAKGLSLAVTERCKIDDRLLDELQAILNATVARSSAREFKPDDEQERAELLLKALRKAKVDEIKDRLDRVYLESLHRQKKASNPGGDRHGQEQNQAETATTAEHDDQATSQGLITELQEEIQSLYDEIDDVVTMLVGHAHGAPLPTLLANVKRAEQQKKNKALSEAMEKITTMTGDLKALTREVEEKRSERVVLTRMMGEVERVEKEIVSGATTSRSTRTAAPERNMALTELMGHLKLAHTINIEQDGERIGAGHVSLVQRLDSAAQQRRQAVSMLVDAAKSTTNVEVGLEALESRIADVRARLDN